MTDTKKLFEDFPPISTSEWEEKIFKDLRGWDYDEKLVWNTIEGFKIKPYYREEDLKGLEHLKTIPGKYPYVRGNYENNQWEIEQKITVNSIVEANSEALNCVENGVTSLFFELTKEFSSSQINKLLQNIDLAQVDISFSNNNNYIELLEILSALTKSKSLSKDKIKGYLDIDPLAALMMNGSFSNLLPDIINSISDIIHFLNDKLPNYRGININGNIFHNSGADSIQELAFTLSSANEHLVLLTNNGFDIESLTPKFQFTLAVGSNYFIEIAKLRAARLLWSKIVDQYKPSGNVYNKIFIHSETSLWNKSIFDPHTNILRATTEGMSAIIGCTDSVTIHPFDITYKDPDEYSKRIAHNIQNLLKDETHLDKTVDPSAGTYYIEKLTDEIAEKSWNLFKMIESEGGFIEAAKKGFIQGEINKTIEKRNKQINSRKENILGTSLFPNSSETMLDKIDKDLIIQSKDEPTMVIPLTLHRKAEPFEKLRLKTEKFGKEGGKIPKVFLFPIGNHAMSTARSIFSRNFFAVGGFEIQDNHTYESVVTGIKEALQSSAEIVVICSSDDEYPKFAPSIAKNIHQKNPETNVVVAGYPKECLDELKNAGVDNFIHLKSNILETLKEFQHSFSIN